MLIAFDGKTPQVAESAWIAPGAIVIGDVVIGERSTVWPGAVVRGDFAPIRIGADVHIEDNVVIHSGNGIAIGDRVTMGHAAVVHCREVQEGVLLGNNCTVLDGAVIGEYSIIGAGALVSPREVVPPRSLVLGVPGVVTPARPDQLEARLKQQSQGGGYHQNAMRYRAQGIEERELWRSPAG